jgi:hypothetical protein
MIYGGYDMPFFIWVVLGVLLLSAVSGFFYLNHIGRKEEEAERREEEDMADLWDGD